jgi:DNA-binding response OmpR family regulator
MRIRLLLVEDEVSTVFAMREFFAHAGYDVDCAARFDEAAMLLDRYLYEAVITDLHLSKARSGEGMRVSWHARRRNPGACIVMLTGYGSDTTEDEAHRCGVDMYGTKPVELSHLREFVDLVLQRDANATQPSELDTQWRQH